ncbi:hypothetical protein TPA0598_15_00070 [Streptomyces lydicamycinicus]|uniref:Uncharacterized protein n=1 Tax=Streptomyces lydicamycinicus TaxID=1546107 RepID=A0A0P4RHM2_9ACTN|nr:hypothetical protein TPA0598_15_00070 [Streptomyces lydicamycinicus]
MRRPCSATDPGRSRCTQQCQRFPDVLAQVFELAVQTVNVALQIGYRGNGLAGTLARVVGAGARLLLGGPRRSVGGGRERALSQTPC